MDVETTENKFKEMGLTQWMGLTQMDESTHGWG